MTAAPPSLLAVEEIGERSYRAPAPDVPPEGRDVLYSGQLAAQMLMAVDRAGGSAKDVRSIHVIFARAGSASAPVDLVVEPMHGGRTWASDTVTARQGDRVLSRALVLSHARDPDLMAHQPDPPDGVPDPDGLPDAPGLVFPGARWRPVPGAPTDRGVPVEMAWHRFEGAAPTPVVHQAIVSWATCGQVIGLAMRPHADTVHLADAHRSLATGVIAHTLHFVDRFDVTDWLLVVTEAPHAGGGRVLGTGRVLDRHGRLVAVFEQDAMAKAADEAPRDPNRAL
jgi:acyl-CoA thioesterase